jgi:hypothetical protein
MAPSSLAVPIALPSSSQLPLPSTPLHSPPAPDTQSIKREMPLGTLRHNMSKPEREQDQCSIAMKLLSEMELEKLTKKRNYSKTQYEKKKNLQNEWKDVYGVFVPLKKIRLNQDPVTLIAQVLAQKKKKKKQGREEIQELDGKQDVCSRLCKGTVLIDC